MNDDIFENIPDDDQKAFVYLEGIYRRELEEELETQNNGTYEYYRTKYINNVVAAARALEIDGVRDYEAPRSSSNNWEYYEEFSLYVANVITQINIGHARRSRAYSVHLDTAEKRKIRHYVEQIKAVVENSNASTEKRDEIFKKLNALLLEIDRDRTRLEVIADGVRSVARLSGDVEREGAEPWWKWVALIFGIVDEAKEKEGQSSLPAPSERKRIEAPRKQLPKPQSNRDMDDDIPF
ncbi:hypothetical protein V3589_20655 [Sinorhizobium fredii]|uniref:hypothetical protein n=1 Tax=Rhizobium fredii TaxID=380 RepID=UPI0030A85230